MQQPGSTRGHWRRGPHLKQRRQRLGRFIRDRREAQALRMDQVADAIGVSRWTYAAMESGRTSVPAELLPPLAEILSVSVRTIAAAVEASGSTSAARAAA